MTPIRVGLVGTGYAAKVRAENLTADGRSQLVAIVGRDRTRTQEFAQPFEAEVLTDWPALLRRDDIDLVVISTINQEHRAIAQAALEADKHVVMEYPLALDVAEAERLIALATARHRLLHVEHIELLSGIHHAIAQALPEIGTPTYVRYSNINPQQPAPLKWTYQLDQFGFPLVGAVSRIHRLTALFGQVISVSCQARYQPNATNPAFFATCLCSAQLSFASGLVADVVYGKGEGFWQAERDLIIQGETGAIAIQGEQGSLIRLEETRSLDMGTRRGLFAKDTAMVLDHLIQGTPLYVSLDSSLYALRVADAARRSAETQQTVYLVD